VLVVPLRIRGLTRCLTLQRLDGNRASTVPAPAPPAGRRTHDLQLGYGSTAYAMVGRAVAPGCMRDRRTAVPVRTSTSRYGMCRPWRVASTAAAVRVGARSFARMCWQICQSTSRRSNFRDGGERMPAPPRAGVGGFLVDAKESCATLR
jgi:hypothetical protein